MNELFGGTRALVRERYAIFDPASFVPSSLPGWDKALCQVIISPALGARFAQFLVTMQSEGQCQGNTGANQFFVYLLEGPASILIDERRHRLDPGSYVYLPPGKDVQLKSSGPNTRLLLFLRRYEPLPGAPRPIAFVAHERETKPQPLADTPGVQVQALLPALPSFDIGVNILTFEPGASLPAVASPIMERGFCVLRGQGIFRLNSEWHPVQGGDMVWTAPYCPQWFVGVGKPGPSLLYIEDVNRDPL